jgi:hypothetical protein
MFNYRYKVGKIKVILSHKNNFNNMGAVDNSLINSNNRIFQTIINFYNSSNKYSNKEADLILFIIRAAIIFKEIFKMFSINNLNFFNNINRNNKLLQIILHRSNFNNNCKKKVKFYPIINLTIIIKIHLSKDH